jgi:hypothetical protein
MISEAKNIGEDGASTMRSFRMHVNIPESNPEAVSDHQLRF